MSRVLSVAAVTFLAGMMMRATTIPNNGVLWGFIFCTLIGTWEFHAPAEALVKNSLWLVGAGAVGGRDRAAPAASLDRLHRPSGMKGRGLTKGLL